MELPQSEAGFLNAQAAKYALVRQFVFERFPLHDAHLGDVVAALLNASPSLLVNEPDRGSVWEALSELLADEPYLLNPEPTEQSWVRAGGSVHDDPNVRRRRTVTMHRARKARGIAAPVVFDKSADSWGMGFEGPVAPRISDQERMVERNRELDAQELRDGKHNIQDYKN